MYNNNSNIPQSYGNMQHNRPRFNNQQNNNDRLLGGGFFGPFILGGITGGLIANSRPNYYYPMYYSPYPYQSYPYYPYRYY